MANRRKEREVDRRGGLAPLRVAIDGFLNTSGMAPRLRGAQVLGAWREVVAPAVARRARAVRFDRGELVVEVASAPCLHELESFTGENYRRAANARLGSERIRRVTFRLKK
jgi:hypothetical protein